MQEDKKEINANLESSPVQLSGKEPVNNVEPVTQGQDPQVENVTQVEQTTTPTVEVSTGEVFSQPVEEPKKKAKGGVIVATVLIVVCVLGLGTLGVFKLLDYLNKPKTLFYSVVESAYNDFTSAMDKIKNNELYSNYLSGTLEYDGDIKLAMNGGDNDFAEILKNYSIKTAVKVDKANNYMSLDLKAVEGQEEKIELQLVDKNLKYFVRVPQLFDKTVEINMEHVNFDTFDVQKNIYLGDIFKREILTALDDGKFESEDVNLLVNGQNLECKKSSYTFKGSELTQLINNIVSQMKLNSNDVYTYLSELTGWSKEELDKNIDEFIRTLDIPADLDYVVSAYTKKTTDEAVRLEMSFKTKVENEYKDVVIAYNKDLNYISFEEIEGQVTVSKMEIKGDLNSSCVLTYAEPGQVLTYVSKSDAGKNDALITITDTTKNKELYSIKYNSTIEDKGNDGKKVKIEAELKSDDDTIKVIMDGTLKLGGKIEQVDTKGAINIDKLTDEDKASIESKLAAMMNPQVESGELEEVPTN